MDIYPQAYETDRSIVVKFTSDLEQRKSFPVRMTLDFDSYGEIVGIEIINLVVQIGSKALQLLNRILPTARGRLHVAYDEESDSFYLRLRDCNSVDQKTVHGHVFLDDDDHIIGLHADWT